MDARSEAGLPAGWITKPLADGALFVPPGGRAAGAIRLQRQVRPLARLADIVAADLAQARAFLDDVALEPGERRTTDEGEHAAVITLRGRSRDGGGPVERTVGVVFGDDYYRRYDALAPAPAAFAPMRATIRALVKAAALGLGERRSRRFAYAPPAGWQGRAVGLVAEWYPEDYPRERSVITVLPAAPAGQTGTSLLARKPHGFEVRHSWAAVPSRHGLTGRAWCAESRDGSERWEAVELTCRNHVYGLTLRCDAALYARHHDLIAALALSVEPVPQPVQQVSADVM